MLVRDRMSRKVLCVAPQRPLAEAQALLDRHGIRHLPVGTRARLLGIISDRDLRAAPPGAKTVRDIMTVRPMVLAPTASVDEAAALMQAHKINALPVLERGRVVGILTSTDVLDAFVDLSGVAEPTYRLELRVADARQAVAEIRQAVCRCRGELKWVHADSPQRVHVRVKARRIDDVVTALEAAACEVTALVAPRQHLQLPVSRRRRAP
jgi:acetoin utilization protein AcuB